jgi:hypothetical protein
MHIASPVLFAGQKDGSSLFTGVYMDENGLVGLKLAADGDPFTKTSNHTFLLKNDGTSKIAGWSFDTTTLSSGNLKLVSGSTPQIQLGASAYEGTGIWMGLNSSAWKFSAVSASNYLKWNGTSLDIKGDLVLGSGDNEIIFEDANMSMADYGIDEGRSRVSIKGINDQNNFIFSDSASSGSYSNRFTMSTYVSSSGYVPCSYVELISVNNTSAGSDYTFQYSGIRFGAKNVSGSLNEASIILRKLSNNGSYGYLDIDAPIKINYSTGQDAASMPVGSFFVQGDYFFFRSSAGWIRIGSGGISATSPS